MRHHQGWLGYRSQPAPTRKVPGRLEQAARRKARAAAPYAAGLGAALTAAVLLHSLAPFWVAIGLTAMHAGLRLAEAVDVRRNGGRRAARQRRKWQGTESWRGARKHLGLGAARRMTRITRPQTHHPRMPAHEAGVHVGTARHRRLYVTHEDSLIYIGGSRCGKSTEIAKQILKAPGAAVTSSSRPDLYKRTAAQRAAKGPVWVLNPGGYGNVPTTLRWSPLDGCETAQGAISAAGYLMAAAPQGDANAAYFLQQAHTLLRLYMHAAILGGYSIFDVRSWVMDPANLDALTVLDNHPMTADGWDDELAAILLSSDGSEAQNSVQSTAKSALEWLADPAMKAVACARPDQWLDMEAFIEAGCGTVYNIGDDRPHNPLTPFLACFNGHAFETAKKVAGWSPGGRLDPPFTLAPDEVALNKPPLPRWTAEAGGYNIFLIAACQSLSQLDELYGEKGADTVFDNMTKVVFGGMAVASNLEKISHACGEYDTWEHVKDADGKKRRQPAAPRRTFPPERIKSGLPLGTALLMHRRMRPLVVTLKPLGDTLAPPVAVTAPLVPLDGAVIPPAVPGHLSGGPLNAAAAPARAVAAPTRPALEEPHGQDW